MVNWNNKFLWQPFPFSFQSHIYHSSSHSGIDLTYLDTQRIQSLTGDFSSKKVHRGKVRQYSRKNCAPYCVSDKMISPISSSETTQTTPKIRTIRFDYPHLSPCFYSTNSQRKKDAQLILTFVVWRIVSGYSEYPDM